MTTLDIRTHPLAMTAEVEVRTVREVRGGGGAAVGDGPLRLLCPRGAPKDAVLFGAATDRRFRTVLLDMESGRSWDTIVSVDSRSVVSSREIDPPREGQPPIIDSEFEDRRGRPQRRSAVARCPGGARHQAGSVRAVPLAAGVYDLPEEVGRRMCRTRKGIWSSEVK